MLMTATPYYGRRTVATPTLHRVPCKRMGAHAERALGLGLGLGLSLRLRLGLRLRLRLRLTLRLTLRAKARVRVRVRVPLLWPYLLRLSDIMALLTRVLTRPT